MTSDRNPEFEPRTSINPSAKAGDTLPGSGLTALSDPVYNENAAAPRPTAAETLNGADSKQLHDGLGHPGAGQTSAEVCDTLSTILTFARDDIHQSIARIVRFIDLYLCLYSTAAP